jgi:hypothetical protein
MTPEGRVKAKVNKMLAEFGSDCWRFMPVQSGYGTPALDYLLCFRGHFVAIETKKAGEDLTPLQKSTRRDMWGAGGIVLRVCNDVELEEARNVLSKLGWCHGREEQIPGYVEEGRNTSLVF